MAAKTKSANLQNESYAMTLSASEPVDPNVHTNFVNLRKSSVKAKDQSRNMQAAGENSFSDTPDTKIIYPAIKTMATKDSQTAKNGTSRAEEGKSTAPITPLTSPAAPLPV